jgi:hypothetical protein
MEYGDASASEPRCEGDVVVSEGSDDAAHVEAHLLEPELEGLVGDYEEVFVGVAEFFRLRL